MEKTKELEYIKSILLRISQNHKLIDKIRVGEFSWSDIDNIFYEYTYEERTYKESYLMISDFIHFIKNEHNNYIRICNDMVDVYACEYDEVYDLVYMGRIRDIVTPREFWD